MQRRHLPFGFGTGRHGELNYIAEQYTFPNTHTNFQLFYHLMHSCLGIGLNSVLLLGGEADPPQCRPQSLRDHSRDHDQPTRHCVFKGNAGGDLL